MSARHHVIAARSLWREARRARAEGWPDVAIGYERIARRHIALARACR